jgi:hypothetical protein
MNDQNRRELESGQRCRQWITDYKQLIPAGSIFSTKTSTLKTVVDRLEARAGDVAAAKGDGHGATEVKGSERNNLIDVLEPVRNAARAAEFDVPGTRDRYRFNLAMSHKDLLAAGRAFAAGGATDEALLARWGAPAGWVGLVTAACDSFEAAFGLQHSAVGNRIAGHADINNDLDELTKLKGAIRHLVKNYAANDPGALAAWTSAARVEHPPKAAKSAPAATT